MYDASNNFTLWITHKVLFYPLVLSESKSMKNGWFFLYDFSDNDSWQALHFLNSIWTRGNTCLSMKLRGCLSCYIALSLAALLHE